MPFSISPLLRAGMLFLFTFSLHATVASAATEFNPAHNVRVKPPADSARVIVKFRADSAVLRAHALKADATATEMRDAVGARAAALGARVGLKLEAGRAVGADAQVLSAPGMSSAA